MVAFLVMQPFLTSTLVAAVLATLFYPQYRFLLRIFGGRSSVSALGILLCVAFLVIIPIVLLGTLVMSEATSALSAFSAGNHSIGGAAQTVEIWLSRFPYLGEYFRSQNIQSGNILEKISGGSGVVLSFLGTLYGSATGFIFWIFALFFTLFYFLVDGARAVRFLKRVSPLSDDDDDTLMREFASMSRAIIKGSFIIAIIQGIVGGIGFSVAGFSSPAIWGAAMGLFSLIPFVGSGIIWLPVGIWLLFSGDVWQGVFLLLYGVSIVATIDNVVRPKLVGRDTQVHPLLVFFSTIGGLSFFGITGFLVGPLLVSFFLALVRIYAREFKTDLESYNKSGLT
jgi:predicted PurR-regulated permease PerM